jgi:hypothetical protein
MFNIEEYNNSRLPLLRMNTTVYLASMGIWCSFSWCFVAGE